MASNLTRLEDKLDELLVEYLTALSTYIAAQEKLASQLKNGFFELARAKLALGASRVGPSSYDLSEHPSRFLVDIQETIAPADSTETSKIEIDSPPSLAFTLQLRVIPVEEVVIDSVTAVKLEEVGLRKRLPTSKSKSQPSTDTLPAKLSDTSPPDTSLSTLSQQKTTSPPDPILQFSGFPPPALRNSQKLFQESISTGLKVVALKLILEGITDRVDKCRNEIESL